MTIYLPRALDPLAPLDSPLAKPDSSWRWATVSTTNPVRIRYDGDSQDLGMTPEWLVAGVAPSVGLRVWTQTYGRRVLVAGAAGAGSGSAYARTAWSRATATATGGGTWLSTAAGVGFQNRIVIAGLGRGTTWTNTGTWELTMPPNGTVIPGYGGSAGATVAGGLIPMAAYEVLYVELPTPGSGTTLPASSLRLVGTSATFELPEAWFPIVARTVDGVSTTYRTVTGEQVDYWRTPTFQNGWKNLGSGFSTAAYRKEGGVVRLRGVVNSGTLDGGGGATATIFTLPAGFRPELRTMHAVSSANPGDAYGRVDVGTDGTVKAIAGSNSFMSLDNVSFRAYN